MDFLGIGPGELLLIFIIALIVLGPRRLPEVARQIGKLLGDLQRTSAGFTAELTRELDLAAQEAKSAPPADEEAAAPSTELSPPEKQEQV
jgi:sec-independent protein translocase protein TatB